MYFRFAAFIHVCASVSVPMCVFAYSVFISPPEQGVFSYLWPLQVQGWHAITKTALSITLTDRLKRGFNSYSSPWALHHRGRYPSTPLLSPFIVSSCQSLGGLAKWPLLLLRSCYCVLAHGLRRYGNSRKSLIVELKGWRCVARHDITRLTTHRGLDDVSMKRSACTIPFVHVMSFSCNGSRLSQQTVRPSREWPCQSPLLPAFLWFLNNHSLHPSTIPAVLPSLQA